MSDTKFATNLPYKSVFLAILLGLAGPIGLLYTTWLGSLIMIILGVIVSAIPKLGGALVALVWLVCLFWNTIAVERYNAKLLDKYKS
jgi:hypothetical protein